MVAVSQTDTVWSIWSGVEDYLECDTRLEKYPLEKWYLKMASLIRGAKYTLGIKLVLTEYGKDKETPLLK